MKDSSPADKHPFDFSQKNQHHNNQQSCHYSDGEHAFADSDANRSDQQNRGRGGQSANRTARLKNYTGTDEPNRRYDLRYQARRIGVRRTATDVTRNNHEKRRTDADEHVGSQTCRFTAQFALETNCSAA